MNILILNWRDPKHPLAGGAEISLEKQARYWVKKGAGVTWFSSHFKDARGEENVDGISYIRRGNHFTVSLSYLFYAFGKGYSQYDVIIDSFHFFPFFTPLYIHNKKIIGLINEVAGNVWFENLPYPLALIGYFLEPFVIRLYKSKHFITGSNSARDDLVRVGLDGKKITVVHHGFTPSVKSNKNIKKEKNPTLVFLARLSKDKGIEDAVMTLSMLREKHANIKLWIIGKAESPEYEKRLRKLIERYQLRTSCVFYGFVNEEKKYELLTKAWILVHPSKKEGWGLNVIEANSVGTPCVGYNVPGLMDSVVDGKTGLLVRSMPDRLFQAIDSLLSSRIELERLSKNAMLWSRNFSWEKASKESWDILNS